MLADKADLAAFSNSSVYAFLVASSILVNFLVVLITLFIVSIICLFSLSKLSIKLLLWYFPASNFFNLLSAKFVNPVSLTLAPFVTFSSNRFLLVLVFNSWFFNSLSYTLSPGLLGSATKLLLSEATIKPSSANSLFTASKSFPFI